MKRLVSRHAAIVASCLSFDASAVLRLLSHDIAGCPRRRLAAGTSNYVAIFRRFLPDAMLVLVVFFVMTYSQARADDSGNKTGAAPDSQVVENSIHVTPEAALPLWQQLWENARQSTREGRVAEAVELYRRVLKERPGLVEARWELTQLLMKQGAESASIQELEQIVEVRPEDQRALFQLAVLLKQTGQYERAASIYEKLLSIVEEAPSDTHDGSAERSDARLHAGLWEIERDVSLCFEAMHETEKAITHMRRSLFLHPDQPWLELKLAYFLQGSGREEKALPHFRKLFPLHARDPRFLDAYAKALLRAEDFPGAKKMLEIMTDILLSAEGADSKGIDRSWALSQLTDLYEREGAAVSAVSLLEKWVKKPQFENDPRLLTSLGRFYVEVHSYLKAIETIKKVVRQKEDDVEALLVLGKAYERLQLYEQAVSCYRKALGIQPVDSVRFRLMKVLAESGEFSRARAVMDSISGNVEGADSEETSLLLSEIFVETGAVQEVEEMLVKDEALFQDQAFLASYIALVLGMNGRISGRRLGLFTRSMEALAVRGEYWRIVLQAGTGALVESGHPDAAENILELCWEKGGCRWALEELVDLAVKHGWTRTLEIFDESVSVGRASSRQKFVYARLLLEAGLPAKAGKILESLRPGVRGDWYIEKYYLYSAEVATLSGRYEDALGIYAELLDRFPNHLYARIGKLKCFVYYGLWPEVLAEAQGIQFLAGYEPAAKGREDWVGVRRSSGSVMMPANETEEASNQPPRQIIETQGCENGDLACFITLALSYERNSRPQEAVAVWRSIIRRHPEYWPGYEHLSRILSEIRESGEAGRIRNTACSRIQKYRHALGGCARGETSTDDRFSVAMTGSGNAWFEAAGLTGQAESCGDSLSRVGPDVWKCLAVQAATLWESSFCR